MLSSVLITNTTTDPVLTNLISAFMLLFFCAVPLNVSIKASLDAVALSGFFFEGWGTSNTFREHLCQILEKAVSAKISNYSLHLPSSLHIFVLGKFDAHSRRKKNLSPLLCNCLNENFRGLVFAQSEYIRKSANDGSCVKWSSVVSY